ncbi:MAG: hypothetical protein EKK57_02685 [Proteobacteria bacterium]|nr:MAG: hypothetical protein EKK57_02685 [Pseudomonadota bacterium]
MHKANLLSILEYIAQEVERVKRIDYAVNNVLQHPMFPADVDVTYTNKKLSILQGGTPAVVFLCDGKASILSQITEVKETLGLNKKEFMLHRMWNER